MTAILERNEAKSLWARFCAWISATDNRLYIGWFGTVMLPIGVLRTFNLLTPLNFCIPQKLSDYKIKLETRLNRRNPFMFSLSSLNPGDSNESIEDNPVPNPIAPKQLPGVYMIRCLENDKRYYGQSNDVSRRLSERKFYLRKGLHEIKNMQADFKRYTEEKFEFLPISLSKDLTIEKRKELENTLISRYNNICYNKTSHTQENNPFFGRKHDKEMYEKFSKAIVENIKNSIIDGFPISLKDLTYPSISDGSRKSIQLPGVYMIRCLENDKRYYGEAGNVSARLSSHKSMLHRNAHKNLELQADFNLYVQETFEFADFNLYVEKKFEFTPIYMATDFTLDKRKELESELVVLFNNNCYNKHSKINLKNENNPFYGHKHTKETIERMKKSHAENKKNSLLEGFSIANRGKPKRFSYYKKVYPSLREASKQLGFNRKTIQRFLRDDPENCFIIED
jgi:predicted GIY-YIG superfamily endonuclease